MAKLPEGDHIRGVEVLGRYDGIAYYEDRNTGQRYSKIAHIPIEKDELCKYGKIHKVEQIGKYDYKILSSRLDSDSMPCDTTSM